MCSVNQMLEKVESRDLYSDRDFFHGHRITASSSSSSLSTRETFIRFC